MSDSKGVVGIFDSGVGGLTVMHRIAERLPNESICYLGDTARVPYGTKSPATVVRYALACAKKLVERKAKLLVVACNTASAFALEELRDQLAIPVLGVIEPGASWAVKQTRNGRIGVIGTSGTIGSGAYQQILTDLAPELHIACKACPLFVPLAEEGWVEGSIPLSIAREYLKDLFEETIDTLVLGCTHYPLLKNVIQEIAGPDVSLVDSAEATSRVVAEILEMAGLAATTDEPGRRSFLVTDDPVSFTKAGERFLGNAVNGVEWIDI